MKLNITKNISLVITHTLRPAEYPRSYRVPRSEGLQCCQWSDCPALQVSSCIEALHCPLRVTAAVPQELLFCIHGI